MLREEDIRIDWGRASHGGNCARMVHIPTGINRIHPGPMGDLSSHELQQIWLQEIEAELIAKGLTDHIIADYSAKCRRQSGRK